MNPSKRQVPGTPAQAFRTGLSTLVYALVFWGSLASLATGTNLTVQVLSEFHLAGTGPKSPYGRLVQGTNGDFYGTTYGGGSSNLGTIFKITSSGTLRTLFSFSRTNGSNPYYGGLMRASDGNFYGNCYIGGASNLRSIFRITHGGGFTNLFSFRNTNGSFPQGWLAQAADGNFYGTTFNGGAADLGTVFKVSTNGVLTPPVSFTGTNGTHPGANPRAGLLLGSAGQFYGTTESGGPADAGTVFQVTTNGGFANLFSFSITNGAYPEACLVSVPDGRFYGTTFGSANGGAASNGTVFALTPAGALQTAVAFDYTNGPGPIGSLALGEDGNFYGTTLSGGYDGVGALFRLVSPPFITSITATGGNVAIAWTAFSNGVYQVQFTPALTANSWTNLAPNVTANGDTASVTDTPTNSKRYYRVNLLP